MSSIVQLPTSIHARQAEAAGPTSDAPGVERTALGAAETGAGRGAEAQTGQGHWGPLGATG
jgi:hypothetical protein